MVPDNIGGLKGHQEQRTERHWIGDGQGQPARPCDCAVMLLAAVVREIKNSPTQQNFSNKRRDGETDQ